MVAARVNQFVRTLESDREEEEEEEGEEEKETSGEKESSEGSEASHFSPRERSIKWFLCFVLRERSCATCNLICIANSTADFRTNVATPRFR